MFKQLLISSFILIALTPLTAKAQFGAAPSNPAAQTDSQEPANGKLTKEQKLKFSKARPEDITNKNFPNLIESFDYPNADISEVVKAISKLTGKNFILEPNVRGKVTIIAPTQITVAEAYKAFLSALAINHLTVVPDGPFLKIRQARSAQRDSIETYAGKYFPDTDQLITRIIKLKYISAEAVQKQIRSLTSQDGDLSAYTPTNSLIISDYGSNIERIQNIINQLDVPGYEEQMAVIRIHYAKAKDIADLIDQIINKDEGKGRYPTRFRRYQPQEGTSGAENYSTVLSDDRTNSIIVVGNKAGIEKIRGLIKKLDFKLRPEDAGGVYVYYVRYGEAEQIANVLNGIAAESNKAKAQKQSPAVPSPYNGMTRPGAATPDASSGAIFGGDVKVTADKVTNSLIITAGRLDYGIVKNLLAKIDIPRDQVYVQTIIMEMNATDSMNVGLDYYQFNADSQGIGRVGFRSSKSLADLTDPNSDSGAILGFGSGSTFNLNIAGQTFPVPTLAVLIKLLKKNTHSDILSKPQILAMDNQDAEIEVGQEIPVGAQENATTTGTVTSIQRENATIKLKITPYISPDTDEVRMKIDQQIKQASNEQVRAAKLADSAVVLNTRNIKTVITVDSGDTAVLGGLMSDDHEINVVKVPILGDIPVLGWLFKSKSNEVTKRNLIVFITPKIIRSHEDNENLLNQKISDRIHFVQRAMNGKDPFGETMDQLPRRASVKEVKPAKPKAPKSDSDNGAEDEPPAVETF